VLQGLKPLLFWADVAAEAATHKTDAQSKTRCVSIATKLAMFRLRRLRIQ
jgi:hypothetical protein